MTSRTDERRALLEAVAYGTDSKISPGDRLKAVELLARYEESDRPSESFWGELSGLEGKELDGHLDAVLAEEIAADVFGPRIAWSQLAALLDREVERRARTLADQAHLDFVEAEITRRVNEERARRVVEPKPEPVGAGRESAMPSSDPSDGARYEPRYESQAGIRRRYRSRLLIG